MKKKKRVVYIEKINIPLDTENHSLTFSFKKVTGGYKVLLIETYYYPEKEKFSYRGTKAKNGLEFMTMIEPDDLRVALRDIKLIDIFSKYKAKDYAYFNELFKV